MSLLLSQLSPPPFVPPLSWLANFPDLLLPPARSPDFQASTILSPARLDVYGWRPSFPDLLLAPPKQQSDPTILSPARLDVYGWRPSFPDAISRILIIQNLLAETLPVPAAAQTPMAFVSFPDLLLAQPRQHPSMTILSPARLDVYGWRPSFPDLLLAPPKRYSDPAIMFPGRLDVYTWRPSFPDLLLPQAKRYSDPTILSPARLDVYGWRPTFPDLLLPQAKRYSDPTILSPARLDVYGWRPSFPDLLLPQAKRYSDPTIFSPSTLDVYGWRPTFPDLLLPQAKRYSDPAIMFPGRLDIYGWRPSFPDLLLRRTTPWSPELGLIPNTTGNLVVWYGSFPDLLLGPPWRPLTWQVLPLITYDKARQVAIHVPDEVPIGAPLTINAECIVGGLAVPFDSLPSLRVYHLDNGVQVTDLPLGPMTQYGVNPSYFRDWTPSGPGTFMVEVLGIQAAQSIEELQPVTVRPKFDPIAIALSDILVSRM